jgi:hypothetical protein
MLYVTAWKRPASRYERARQLTQWLYDQVEPGSATELLDAASIVREGRALCSGYAFALGEMLRNEGFQVRWISMYARDHDRGRSHDRIDAHDVIEVELDSGWRVIDPMSNRIFAVSIDELIREPRHAVPREEVDGRYRERHYELYDTSYWYERVFRLRSRTDPRRRGQWKRVRK